jgi:hypothetical protein
LVEFSIIVHIILKGASVMGVSSQSIISNLLMELILSNLRAALSIYRYSLDLLAYAG